ncbi:NACHT, LRR and PYD domains-containing protein 1b allele 2-like [Lycodopsis pacificus]
MERINSMQYMAAGPLMNITVLAGKLDEVHLPHWICIDDNPTILDKFAVLHIDDCGDVVEKVSEVTSSHVKLCEPVFSLKMAILRFLGVSVEIYCNVLIYKTDKTFLTLDVYLIPHDAGLQQELDKKYGHRLIQKPYPAQSLKLNDSFILTTDLDGAKIELEKLMLRYENPNFFEVFIKNPDKEFELQLKKENEHQPVWTRTIRKDDYQSTAHSQGEHFVDKHRAVLIDRVSNIASILDELLDKNVITQEAYDEILAIPTNREKMRKLYSGPLNAAGYEGKEVFYKILEEKERRLIAELKKKR